MPSVDWGRLGRGVLDEIVDAEAVGLDFGERYQVGETIGAGGQGTVYRCWDRHLGRPVAVKHLEHGAEAAFLAETRLLSGFNHPGIPQLYDQGTCPDGSRFVVVQYIDGSPLHGYLDTVRPDLPARLRIFHGLASALAHAHERGVLHRDLKPGNVLVTETGEPYLVDWGLAATGDPRAVCGTPVFAAPEQLDGQVADARSDVYSLGVLLYFILCGTYPYERDVADFNEFRRLRAGLRRVPLLQRRPELPAYLGRTCEIAMAPQPGARYSDVAAMQRELAAAAISGKVARDDRPLPRGGVAVLVGGSFLMGLLVGGVLVHALPRPAVVPASPPPAPGQDLSLDGLERDAPIDPAGGEAPTPASVVDGATRGVDGATARPLGLAGPDGERSRTTPGGGPDATRLPSVDGRRKDAEEREPTTSDGLPRLEDETGGSE